VNDELEKNYGGRGNGRIDVLTPAFILQGSEGNCRKYQPGQPMHQQIQTRHLPNANQKSYRCQLFRLHDLKNSSDFNVNTIT
jgi:hypothetical protein